MGKTNQKTDSCAFISGSLILKIKRLDLQIPHMHIFLLFILNTFILSLTLDI